ncbi:cytochrome P450 81E8-like [Cucurbita pepo subsp. pepo]|uniref:cytochrome P450 81E8-like n=1 Tax=Cucurbita pepo subsp. pepo TaxID=3664 RepID=UPI000C9D78CA|nr:cytochrome P450 81E8-like [Cucurbita pepo subsp. pepo]
MHSRMEETLLFSNFEVPLLVLILALLLILKFRKADHKNLPPGPPSLPVIGHLHLLKEPFHQMLQDLSHKYGPILSLSLGFRPVVVVSSPAAAQECFSKNDIIFASRPRMISGKILNYDYTAVGATAYGQHWRIMRRIATTELLSTYRLNALINIRQQEVKLWLKSLYRISGKNNVRVEIRSKLTELSFNIALMLMVGKRYFGDEAVDDSEEARELKNTMKQVPLLSGASYPADFLSVLKLVDYQGFRKRLAKVRVDGDAFAQSLIDERRNKKADDNERKTMIDSLLSMQQMEPEYYKDDIIKGQFLTLLAAGTDTTAGTLEWALSLLLNHPTAMKKAWTEINEHVGDERLVEEMDLNQLHYLQGIINETYRLFPALPILVPRESSEDCTIGGFDVPKGTMLVVNAWAIHRDPKVWEDPNSFRPERFKEGESVEVSKLLPFGMGRRACPGAGLAHRVVGLALATLIQCFEWERLDSKEVDLTPGIGLTMPKASPLVAMFKPRTPIIHLLSQL